MHASVVEASELYRQELSRYNYVTPTSYLELLSSYSHLINIRKNALLEGTSRLRIGLEKLQNTSEEVKVLQDNLTVMKPALEKAAIEANIMIEKIAEDTKIAEETKTVVEREEFEATKKALATEEIAEDARRDLEINEDSIFLQRQEDDPVTWSGQKKRKRRALEIFRNKSGGIHIWQIHLISYNYEITD
ncbi:hypothetical protein HHI36_010622 [Cryptolaemus montrouzieri]|uniref:Dynein heavy chain AAA module D4 domain-containing protein n=1 Tax=Cryptolaemus montrouzieri TaxID=559131 RepID=A0ABD2MJB4_9CUCU